MNPCTSCGAALPPSGKFCAQCGTPIDAGDLATLLDDNVDTGTTLSSDASPRKLPAPLIPGQRSTRPVSSSSSLTSSDPLGGARFAPGQILAERYRVVALAGRGGMGEVYRAEDLKLGQVVAIKFLPEALSNDAAALARFHSEVRIARQVSHVNVCRVFDIGEVDGIAFLTMEYVDGEDLASVVRRIGRLSPDKAIEIMRQMCAGLAAAHDRGVIHRDLKPANVMLDSAGKIHITDFGLAGLAANIPGGEIRAGTPAYMAPEQLAGLEVTARSDIFSLGLILYELITGKRVFEASTIAELMKLRDQSQITNPSSIVRDLDPLIERVILRCLEREPAKRPSSALQVAAALPGGDPLAAALAAGETPSPEMVAAAGSSEGLRPKMALTLLLLAILGLLGYALSVENTKLNNLMPMENPPEVLLAKAHDIVKQLGYTEPAQDSSFSFSTVNDFISHIEKNEKSKDRWKILQLGRPPAMVFWYRQSPRQMTAGKYFSSGGAGLVTNSDPPMNVTGMILIGIDMDGRLLHFESVPPQKESGDAKPAAANWAALFAAAGLNPADYQEVKPEWTPLAFADERKAWSGHITSRPDWTERLEAAAYRGRPIYFEAIYPWDQASRDQGFLQSTHERLATLTFLTLFLLILAVSIYVARRTVKQNRGDAKGAGRLATFVQLVFLAMWFLRAHHVASPAEFNVLMLGLAWSFMLYSLARVLYFALEPFVRRRDPHTLISWSRMMAGQWKDPLVGRDLLIGVVYGVLLSVYETSDNWLLPLIGQLPPPPAPLDGESLLGVRTAIGLVLQYTWIFVLYALLIFFLLFLVRLAVKKDWIAALVIVALGAATSTGGNPLATFLFGAVVWLSIYLMLRRFGVLTLVAGLVVQNVLAVFPVTTHLSRWYTTGALTGVAMIVGLAIFGFYTSLGGQSIFSGEFLEK